MQFVNHLCSYIIIKHHKSWYLMVFSKQHQAVFSTKLRHAGHRSSVYSRSVLKPLLIRMTYDIMASMSHDGFLRLWSSTGLSMSSSAPPWQGRSIASSKLRMLEFSAFLEQPQDPETVSPSRIYYWCSCWSTWLTLTDTFVLQVNKHLFVHIGQSNPTYSDPYLEAVDIRQIYDKFQRRKEDWRSCLRKDRLTLSSS